LPVGNAHRAPVVGKNGFAARSGDLSYHINLLVKHVFGGAAKPAVLSSDSLRSRNKS
jgi:hypothetical protein